LLNLIVFQLNIFISLDRRALLGDFGLMTAALDPNSSVAETSTASGGTTRWMAPELLSPGHFGLSRIEPTMASDIYALGMVVLEVRYIMALAVYKALIIFQVLTGNLPFAECKIHYAVGAMVVNGERPARPPASNDLGISDEIWQLLVKCWSADRSNRPGVAGVRELLQEAVPAWAALPVPGCSEDVGDDESDLEWSDCDDTAKVELKESARYSGSNVSDLDTVFDDVSNIVQNTNTISTTIHQAEEPVSRAIVIGVTNGINALLPVVDTGTPRNTRTTTAIASSSNSGTAVRSASSSTKVDDEEKEIRNCRESLNRHPPGHPDRYSSLDRLVYALFDRFQRTSSMEDLEEWVQLGRECLELRPPGHPERHTCLNRLGAALDHRFTQSGKLEDLEESIRLHRQCLELRPSGHPQRDNSLKELGVVLIYHFRRSGRMEDLEESIQFYRQCLQLRPSGHPRRHTPLNGLGVALLDRFRQSNGMEDLEESIQFHRQCLEICPSGALERHSSLNGLGVALKTRFERNGQSQDINEAIRLHCAAVESFPATTSHSNNPQSILFLRQSLQVRFEKTGESCDTDEAMKLYRASLQTGRSGQHQTTVSPLGGGIVSRMRQLALGGRSAEGRLR
jgi:serine/threonine protein kinase